MTVTHISGGITTDVDFLPDDTSFLDLWLIISPFLLLFEPAFLAFVYSISDTILHKWFCFMYIYYHSLIYLVYLEGRANIFMSSKAWIHGSEQLLS